MKKIIIFNASATLYGAERGLLHLIKALGGRFVITVVLPRTGPLVEKIRNMDPGIEIKIFPLPVIGKITAASRVFILSANQGCNL